MKTKRDDDGFFYSGYRVVKKGGSIKIDNKYYQHDKLINMVGDTVFVYRIGDYWKTEYSVYLYGYEYKNDFIICEIS